MGLLKKPLISCATLLLSLSLSAQIEKKEDQQYERSSMHMMMIAHLNQKFDETVELVFKTAPFPERFNNHDLGVKTVAFAETSTDISSHIAEFCKKVNLGQKMVSKWFNRNKGTGSFNMDLIKERGFYNASSSDINKARASLRGKALLEDAGENLIDNTYLLVNDIEYKSKGTSGSFLKMMALACVGAVDAMQNELQAIGGFKVSVRSYLFRLKWNDDIANKFYVDYYTEDGTKAPDKVAAFKGDNTTFEMEYIGKTECEASEQHFSKSKKPADLLSKVLTRALDQNIAVLQHTYPFFRIKAPLISTEPLQACIGMKEDVKPNALYEVLVRVINPDGSVNYDVIGEVKAVKVWDNRFMSYEDEGYDNNIKATTFERVSGKDFARGMLLREK